VQCDEKKPECTQCLRLGKGPCPGYRSFTKFIDEGIKLNKRQQQRTGDNAITVVFQGEKIGHASRRKTSVMTSSVEVSQWPMPERPLSVEVPVSPPPLLQPQSLDGLLLDELVHEGFNLMMVSHLAVVHCGRMQSCLELLPQDPGLLDTLRAGEVMPSYIAYIPQHIGKSRALDRVVDLVFTAAGLLTLPRGVLPPLQLMRKYGTALAELRESILDPVESLSAEVLAACLLLGTYEVSHQNPCQ
jgi:hypothetical protein